MAGRSAFVVFLAVSATVLLASCTPSEGSSRQSPPPNTSGVTGTAPVSPNPSGSSSTGSSPQGSGVTAVESNTAPGSTLALTDSATVRIASDANQPDRWAAFTFDELRIEYRKTGDSDQSRWAFLSYTVTLTSVHNFDFSDGDVLIALEVGLASGSPTKQVTDIGGASLCTPVDSPPIMAVGNSYDSCQTFKVAADDDIVSVTYYGDRNDSSNPYAIRPIVWSVS